jgi:flagellar basal-body rod protein FlgC
MIRSLQISGSALEAERLRLDTITENLANAQTTRTETGRPYQRKQVVFQVAPGENDSGAGVKASVVSTTDPGERLYQPGHPDADASGYVEMPNVNIVEEMVDMVSASRAYQANVAAMNATRDLIRNALTLG